MHKRLLVLISFVLLVGCAASYRIVHSPAPNNAQIAVAKNEIKEGLGRVIISLGTFHYSWAQLDEAIDIYIDGFEVGRIGNKREILAIDLYPSTYSFGYRFLSDKTPSAFIQQLLQIRVVEGEVTYLAATMKSKGWLNPQFFSVFDILEASQGKEIVNSRYLISLDDSTKNQYPWLKKSVEADPDLNKEPSNKVEEPEHKTREEAGITKKADVTVPEKSPDIIQEQPSRSLSATELKSPQEIAKKAFNSTVLLVMEDANGQPLTLGSGFFSRVGQVVTNFHVIEGASQGYAKIVGKTEKYNIEGVIASDQERDLVVLKIAGARSSVLTIGNSESVQVGETIYAVGNPQGLEGTFSQGIISSIREVGFDKILQITAPISPGSSGGPVLNGRGEVIGVSVATFKGGQNLNFAIPSNYLKSLLEKTGPTRPLAQAKPIKPQRTILGDLGSRSSEGVVGSHFAWNENRYMGYYTFSVRNNLREPIGDVVCLLVFYARDGIPIETESFIVRGPIGGNLAIRSPRLGRLEADQVRNLTARTEIRILDFTLFD